MLVKPLIVSPFVMSLGESVTDAEVKTETHRRVLCVCERSFLQEFYTLALAQREEALGPTHPEVHSSCNEDVFPTQACRW